MELGQTQAEAAKAIGVPRNSFARYEHGTGKPHPSNVPGLAAWLGLPVSDVSALARDEYPAGMTDADILAAFDRIERKLAALTRHQGDVDAELADLYQRISQMQAALLESLRLRVQP
jgi:transcriptional regulator with XRE-family HTH domain